jgi:phosphoglycolate phosphatase
LRTIFFDLDGTIIDSFGGFKDALLHAVAPWGLSPDDASVRMGHGPPLRDTFIRLGAGDVELAVTRYRERYTTSSYKEHPVFSGMQEMLEALHSKKIPLFVATSKPTGISTMILEHLELDHLFVEVVGATLDASRDAKIDVLRYAVERASDPEAAVMIGDRKYDIEAANALGMTSIGVTWGGGDRSELELAHADYIVDTVTELTTLLLV